MSNCHDEYLSPREESRIGLFGRPWRTPTLAVNRRHLLAQPQSLRATLSNPGSAVLGRAAVVPDSERTRRA